MESFYQGKTVRVIVGANPGGGHDTYSRLIIRHIGPQIPGSPNLIVENRPGAASALATNLVYRTEPKDGTVVNHFNESFVLTQALGLGEGFEFDVNRLQWLGSASSSFGACVIRTDIGVNSIQDLITSGREITLLTIGRGTASQEIPNVINAALGTRFKLVSGFTGSNELRVAVERKDGDGYCQTFDGLANTARSQIEGGQFKVLVTTAGTPQDHPFLRGVPSAIDLAPTEEKKSLVRAVQAPLDIGRPWVVAPEVPADRVAALRQALFDTLQTPALREEAQRLNLDLAPKRGDQVQQIVASVVNLPEATKAQLREILK